MAFKPITMHQIRQLFGFLSKGHSISSITRLTGIARNTVKVYKRRLADKGLTFEQILGLDDDALSEVLQVENGSNRFQSEQTRLQDLHSRMEYFTEELRRRGVTMQLLWDEYREENPQGYGYTQS